MQVAAENLALVEGILERLLSGDIRPLLDAVADNVVLTVAGPDSDAEADLGTGRAAVLDYFQVLGDLIAFWRVKQAWSGAARVIVHAEERFILQPVGIEAHGELVLFFELDGGWITRLGIVEDPRGTPGVSGYAGREPGRFPALVP